MGYQFGNPYTLLLVASGAVSFGLVAQLWRHRRKRGVWPLLGLLSGAGVWAVSDALRIGAPTRTAVLAWNAVGYAGVVAVAPSAFLFAAAYGGRDQWFRPTRTGALLAVSAGTYLVVLTNPLHGLWRASERVSPGSSLPVLVEQFGPVHRLWIAYVLLFVVPASVWMILTTRRDPAPGLFGGRSGAVLVAFLVPALCSILYVTGLVPVDPTPFGFLVTGAAFTVAVGRYRLLDLGPIARATVFDSMDSGALVLDRDDTVVDANPAALDALETDRSTLVGMSIRDLLADTGVETDRFVDTREFEGTIAVESDSETRHYDLRISPIGTDGTSLGRVAIFGDVTDRVRTREELAARTTALERRNERLEEFASLVSHDLRNPLNVATGSIELARTREDVTHLERAESALHRMDALIDDLLVLSRSETQLEDTVVLDLQPVARAAWEELERDEGRLRVQAETPVVDGDRSQLKHLFANLFRNALDHNDPPVTVTVGPLADGNGFFVADDGCGIDAEDHETVFEHGYTTHSDGTGFGLSIVRHIAEAHGWDVTVTDSQQGGARFEFRTD